MTRRSDHEVNLLFEGLGVLLGQRGKPELFAVRRGELDSEMRSLARRVAGGGGSSAPAFLSEETDAGLLVRLGPFQLCFVTGLSLAPNPAGNSMAVGWRYPAPFSEHLYVDAVLPIGNEHYVAIPDRSACGAITATVSPTEGNIQLMRSFGAPAFSADARIHMVRAFALGLYEPIDDFHDPT